MHWEQFEDAALPHLDSLYQTAYRLVHDPLIAAGSVERAFAEAQKLSHHPIEVHTVRVLLFTRLFSILHGRRKRWLHIREWWTGTPEAHSAGGVADRTEMLRAIDSIPEILREVLLLADVEGFNKSDIQQILGIPAETVAARLADTRERLRAGLASHQPAGRPLLEDPAVA